MITDIATYMYYMAKSYDTSNTTYHGITGPKPKWEQRVDVGLTSQHVTKRISQETFL